jgi:prepilin-type N-terminal cleavage/methylation domain-containing protein
MGGGILSPGHDVARRVGEGPVNRTESGFSLLEIVVAMMLLGLVLIGVAQLNFALARRFYSLSGGAARDAVLAQQVNQFAAMPFDSLKAKAGSITVNKPPIPYTRKITVDSLSPKLRRVTIVITPVNTVFKPDTMVLQRTKPGNNPFNKP